MDAEEGWRSASAAKTHDRVVSVPLMGAGRDRARERAWGRAIDDNAKGDVQPEVVGQAQSQLHGKDRVPTEAEEVIEYAETAGRCELLDVPTHGGLERRRRRRPLGTCAQAQFEQRSPVELAIGQARDAVRRDECLGNHVSREDASELMPKVMSVDATGRERRDIGDEPALHSRSLKDHRGLVDAGASN